MPRANKPFIPGYVWHITHRCHKQEFLLKFSRDRQRWIHLLYEVKKRYGLRVLNYCVTSNHVHLLVKDTAENAIPKSIQLIAGRTAQEYNLRKKRKGAFWEDRYHATAVEADSHFIQCPPNRYRIIDRTSLIDLCGINNSKKLRDTHQQWIEASIGSHKGHRDPNWTESIAVGSKAFVEETKTQLGIGFLKRKVLNRNKDQYCLREAQVPYRADFDTQKSLLSHENKYIWHYC